jgi:hypothetical protein
MPKGFKSMVVMHKNGTGDVLTAATVIADYELSDFFSTVRKDVRPGDFIDFAEAGRRPYEDEDREDVGERRALAAAIPEAFVAPEPPRNLPEPVEADGPAEQD